MYSTYSTCTMTFSLHAFVLIQSLYSVCVCVCATKKNIYHGGSCAALFQSDAGGEGGGEERFLAIDRRTQVKSSRAQRGLFTELYVKSRRERGSEGEGWDRGARVTLKVGHFFLL